MTKRITALLGAFLMFGALVAMPLNAQASEDGEDAIEEVSEVQYVRLDPLILPIIDEYGVTQTVSLVVILEVPDQFTVGEVKKMSPRLKDAYIQDMYGMLNRKSTVQNGVLKVKKIKARLRQITMRILGDDVVNDVLLDVVQQNRI